MKKILVVQPLRPEALRVFEARSDVRYEVVTDFSRDNLLRHVGDADAITVRDAPLSIEVLEAAPNLRVVSRHGVGYDNVPVEYCTARGLPVTVVGDVNAISVAEQTMFLMLAAARNGVQLDQAVRTGDFSARSRIIGIELKGRLLLLIGYGRIGREVAARATAFGMRVLIFDPFADRTGQVLGQFVESLEEGLAAADVVSLHVPLLSGTRNMIGAQEVDAMRSGAILVNTARGGLVDEDAVVAALRSGKLRAAAFDTFVVEPLPVEHGLIGEKNTVLSPHSAALTEQALIAMGVVTAMNALAGLDGCLDRRLVVNAAALDGGHYASA